MAGAYLCTLAAEDRLHLKNGVNSILVWAEDATDAETLAKACHDFGASDAAWAAATYTLCAAGANFLGWRLRIKVQGATGVDVTVTGAAAATVDDIGDLMVIALNATTPIANSAYATPALTISSIADGIGDHKVYAWFLPPLASTTWPDPTVSLAGAMGAIVDEGIAAAVLTIQLVPAVAIPALVGRLAST